MAVTYSSAVSAAAPAIVDTNASQSTGAVSTGIGLKLADGVSIAASRIGGVPIADLKSETGDGVGI